MPSTGLSDSFSGDAEGLRKQNKELLAKVERLKKQLKKAGVMPPEFDENGDPKQPKDAS